MKHLPGSLKSLAKDFTSGTALKGYFPHLFNTEANAGYIGPIPHPDYFDLISITKTEKDRDDFFAWYNTQEGDWDLEKELLKYCENDVELLRIIVETHHQSCIEMVGMSPWGFTTAPSFVHETILQDVFLNYDLGSLSGDVAEKEHQLNELAKTSGWPVLNQSEALMARGALRGGRTDARRLCVELSDEEKAAGHRIVMQDICSEYPFAQISKRFPVGTPLVEVYDMLFKPCLTHAGALYQDGVGCRCPLNTTGNTAWKKPWELEEPTKEYILEKARVYGGFIYADVSPPNNLVHPILIGFDKVRKKCIASLERITDYFTMAEFVIALNHGYVINKVYRIDWYRMAPGLWNNMLKKFFMAKYQYSNDMPTPEEQLETIDGYEEVFGMGDDFRKLYAHNACQKMPAKKIAAKTMINSAWGKHAQRSMFDETIMADLNDDISVLLENIEQENTELVSMNFIGSQAKITTKNDIRKVQTNNFNTYIAAAAYVPAYGRIQLWEQMHKLGTRAAYNDTDSLFYIYRPDMYNIPEGKLLGDWEMEVSNIVAAYFIGPKTYCYKKADGKVVVKAKGVTLNYGTDNLVCFERMKAHLEEFMSNGKAAPILVPQSNFVARPGKGIVSNINLKMFGITKESLKGKLIDGYLYPFGYDEAIIN